MTDRIFQPTLAAATPNPRAAIAQAAQRTGVDFDYLVAQAEIESGMNPRAEARTSSASGLFQFIDQTWLATLDRHGEALGYGDMARAIETRNGRARITDPAMRGAIMELRFDPQAASLMAGALATDNRAVLQGVLGRDPDPSELYVAHFLGVGDASRFLSVLSSDPDRSAAELLPRAASANRAIFHNSSGSPRSVGEMMTVIRNRVEGAMARDRSASGVNFASALSPGGARLTARGQGQPAPAARPVSSPEVPRLPSMADTLRDSFALSDAAPDAPGITHIRSAYARLEVFGL